MSLRWADYAGIAQVTAEAVTDRLIGRLDVLPGQRVLEIGTGSGFSSAVLARLVGPGGRVTSVEIVPELVERARALHAVDGVAVDVRVGDGRYGAVDAGPFDRIVAWATQVGGIPRAWFDQLAEGGVLLAPVAVGPLTGCTVVTRWVLRGGTPVGTDVLAGSFAPLDDRPRRSFGGPWAPDDAVVVVDGQPRHWLSAGWIRALPADERTALASRTARLLPAAAPPIDPVALRMFLLAAQPAGLTTGFWAGIGVGIGCSDPTGLAVRFADAVLLDGDPAVADRLLVWIDRSHTAALPRPVVTDPTAELAHVQIRNAL